MARRSTDTVPLASYWSMPVGSTIGEAGRPLICVTSTYTFHASFFELDLLPRFLGMKFDETEGTRPFIIEREQALAEARVIVLVDADHLDPSQTTLRTIACSRVRRRPALQNIGAYLGKSCAPNCLIG
jgi:hypothetical protein